MHSEQATYALEAVKSAKEGVDNALLAAQVSTWFNRYGCTNGRKPDPQAPQKIPMGDEMIWIWVMTLKVQMLAQKAEK